MKKLLLLIALGLAAQQTDDQRIAQFLHVAPQHFTCATSGGYRTCQIPNEKNPDPKYHFLVVMDNLTPHEMTVIMPSPVRMCLIDSKPPLGRAASFQSGTIKFNTTSLGVSEINCDPYPLPGVRVPPRFNKPLPGAK